MTHISYESSGKTAGNDMSASVPHIAGLITDNDIEVLSAREIDQERLIAIRRGLGLSGVVADMTVAVRPVLDDEGGVINAEYYFVDDGDTGTRLRNETIERFGLPDPKHVATEMMHDKSIGTKDVPDNYDVDAEREVSEDERAAREHIAAVIGTGKEAQNLLAKTLLTMDSSPAGIRRMLADKTHNTEFRDQVKSVLATRMALLLAQGGKFHSRVQLNNPGDKVAVKNQQRFGYERSHYSSDEYVVLLALAKLDGSFDVSQMWNKFDNLKPGDQHKGQHRQAAETLLESFAAENEPADIKPGVFEDEETAQMRQKLRELDAQLKDNFTIDQTLLLQLEDMVRRPMFDTNEIHNIINQLAQGLQRAYDNFSAAIQEVKNGRSAIDETTLEGVAKANKIDLIEQSLRKLLDHIGNQAGYSGVGMIDKLTSELEYDNNMMLQYRSQVPQLTETIRQTYLGARRGVESIEL